MGRPYGGLPVPRNGYKRVGKGLFTRAHSDRMKGNGFKLKISTFRLGGKMKFFAVSVVKHLQRVLRETVDPSFLKVFKKSLDGALSNLMELKVSCPWMWGWYQMIIKVSSNSGHSLILKSNKILSFWLVVV